MLAKQLDYRRGFTLTEVAVTLVIVGVISALALPALASMVGNNRVKQTTTEMMMTFSYARNEAITRNAQVSVVAFGTWSAGWQVIADGTTLRQTILNGEVTVVGPVANTVTYTPNGRLATLTA